MNHYYYWAFFIYVLVVVKLGFVVNKFFSSVFVKNGYVAVPNKRSNHSQPIPISGGISILTTFILTLFPSLFFFENWEIIKVITFAFAVLTVVFFLDDLFDISIAIRLVTQAIVAITTSFALLKYGSLSAVILGDILITYHKYIDFFVYTIFLVGFINYFNFMDGIDGMSSVEMTSILVSTMVILLVSATESSIIFVIILFMAASVGFMWNNWSPAKVFLGDSGSIPIGYILALLMLIFAIKGLWLQMIIISAYYLVEPTIVICKLAIQKKKFWLPHNEYFFHKVAKAGVKHSSIVMQVLKCNAALLLLAVFSIYYSEIPPIVYLTLSFLFVMALLFHFNNITISKGAEKDI